MFERGSVLWLESAVTRADAGVVLRSELRSCPPLTTASVRLTLPVMRIDGRFDPKQWVHPRPDEAAVSPDLNQQQQEGLLSFTVSQSHESDADFAREIEKSYGFKHAFRTAEVVSEMLEATPDL